MEDFSKERKKKREASRKCSRGTFFCNVGFRAVCSVRVSSFCSLLEDGFGGWEIWAVGMLRNFVSSRNICFQLRTSLN